MQKNVTRRHLTDFIYTLSSFAHRYVNICLLPKKNLTQNMKTTVKTGNNPVYDETFMVRFTMKVIKRSPTNLVHNKGYHIAIILYNNIIQSYK